MVRKFAYILLGASMMVGSIAFALPTSQNFQNIQPFQTDLYSNGTSTNEWYQLFTKYASTTGALSAPTICLTGDSCRTTWPSSGALFPFTPQTWGNSTTTPLGFLNGFLSTASSTINANLFITNLAQGLLFNGTNGLTSSVPTSTLSASSPLTGSFTQIGSGGSLGIQQANTSQNGFLSSTDWNTFNNKGSGTVTSITLNGLDGVTPITTTGTIIAQVATSAVPTLGNLSYWTGVGTPSTLGTVATSAPSQGTGITLSGIGSVVGGSLSITNSGVISIGNGTGINCSGTNPATCSLVAPVSIANGGTNATSMTTSGNAVYYDGTRLATALTTTKVTAPYASSTAHTVSGELGAPNSGTVPALFAGDLYVNTNSTASSSIVTNDGSATHTLFAVHSMSMVLASSTLVYDGAFGASASTTIRIANPLHSSTLRSIFCSTDIGTAWVAFGTGSATSSAAQCSVAGGKATVSTNNTWTGRQTIFMEIGNSASAPNLMTVTADVEDSN